MRMPRFFPGTVVHLKSGSKDMTVKEPVLSDKKSDEQQEPYDGKLILIWEENGEFIEKEFHEDLLEKSDKQS